MKNLRSAYFSSLLIIYRLDLLYLARAYTYSEKIKIINSASKIAKKNQKSQNYKIYEKSEKCILFVFMNNIQTRFTISCTGLYLQ